MLGRGFLVKKQKLKQKQEKQQQQCVVQPMGRQCERSKSYHSGHVSMDAILE